jgi:hypothetical protein
MNRRFWNFTQKFAAELVTYWISGDLSGISAASGNSTNYTTRLWKMSDPGARDCTWHTSPRIRDGTWPTPYIYCNYS